MKYFFLLLAVSISFYISAEEELFSVKASVSSASIAIDQTVTLQITLTYPPHFHPSESLLKKRLLGYAGFNEPPFTLSQYVKHPLEKNKGSITEQFDFILSPQLEGKHYLTANMIQFDPDKNGEKSVEIPSEIFKIDVFIPHAEFDILSTIEPPIGFSQDLPVSLSTENRKNYLSKVLIIENEREKNKQLLARKAFPWLPLTAAFAVFVVIFLARLLPSRIAEEKIETETIEKNEFEIKQELQKTLLKTPKEQNETAFFITHLDFLLRRYLNNKYQFPAFSFTGPELILKTASLKDMPPSLKEALSKIFKLADQIKFAHYAATLEDCQDMPEMVKELLK